MKLKAVKLICISLTSAMTLDGRYKKRNSGNEDNVKDGTHLLKKIECGREETWKEKVLG